MVAYVGFKRKFVRMNPEGVPDLRGGDPRTFNNDQELNFTRLTLISSTIIPLNSCIMRLHFVAMLLLESVWDSI